MGLIRNIQHQQVAHINFAASFGDSKNEEEI